MLPGQTRARYALPRVVVPVLALGFGLRLVAGDPAAIDRMRAATPPSYPWIEPPAEPSTSSEPSPTPTAEPEASRSFPTLPNPPTPPPSAGFDLGGPLVSEPQPVASSAVLVDSLRQWEASVRRAPGAPDLAAHYGPRVSRHGGVQANTGLRTPVDVGGTFELDLDRSTWTTESPDTDRLPSTCRSFGDPSTQVLRVLAWATETNPQRSPSIGCFRLEGRYLLRLRSVGGRLQICHETWTLRDGICASCPSAAVCRS